MFEISYTLFCFENTDRIGMFWSQNNKRKEKEHCNGNLSLKILSDLNR